VTGTHKLKGVQGGSSQEMQRKQARNRHLHPGEGTGTIKSGNANLKKQASDGHSLSGEVTGMVKSGNGKKGSKQRALTSWRRHIEGQVRRWKESERQVLTLWRGHREGQVRKFKESERAMGAHELERAEGVSSKEIQRKRVSSGHSLSGESTGWVKSENAKKASKQRALTLWRGHREGQVRKCTESEAATGTHGLESAQGRSSQETQRKRASSGNSLSGESTGWVK
jgi:hypothetical protein